jgi:hypothetical protein
LVALCKFLAISIIFSKGKMSKPRESNFSDICEYNIGVP